MQHAVQGQRSVGSEDTGNKQTDGRIDGRTGVIALLAALMRSVNIGNLVRVYVNVEPSAATETSVYSLLCTVRSEHDSVFTMTEISRNITI